MEAPVPPVTRGEFLYRDVLLVDCGGELKRHARALESEIKQQLSGKDVKDQVGHWYEAQLIHYGLQRSKDKNAAKVRLQQALSQGKLKKQPSHLADMEGQMKKEYAAAVRKAKKGDSGKGNKRGRDEDTMAESAKRTKVSVTVDGVSINIDRSDASKTKSAKPATSKATPKATPAKPPKSTPKTSKTEPASKTTNTKGTAGKKKSAAELSSNPNQHPDNTFQRSSLFNPSPSPDHTPRAGRPKQTARKSAPMLGFRVEAERMMIQNEPKIKMEPTVKKGSAIKKEPKIKPEQKVKNEPGTQRQTAIKNEPLDSYEPNDSMDTQPDISQGQLNLTGVYNIDCPQLTFQSPEDADKLRLFICVDNENGLIWGGFELGWKSGIIKIDDIAFKQDLSFGWRAKDYQANGSLRFGKGCFGEIQFYGDEQVRGTFHNLFPESVAFIGSRRPGPLWCGWSAYKFKQQWDDYPKEAYGR